MKQPSRLAFTLVEGLVVLAIIALLASLLLPAVNRGKTKSRELQCINNLRQWGLAYHQYADDSEDCLPRRGQGVKPLEQIDRPTDWFNALPPYLKAIPYEQLSTNRQRLVVRSQSVFVCPVATDPGSNHFLPYGMNMNLCPWGDSGKSEPTKLGEVRLPAQVVALGDAPGPYSATYPSKNLYSPVPRHDSRVNLLFVMGNVASFTGAYVGCGMGEPRREDVRWLTGTVSDGGVDKY